MLSERCVIDRGRVAELNAAGLNDSQIARELGTVRSSVWWVRAVVLGLSARRAWRAFTDDQLRERHARGLTDGQIGKLFRVNKQVVPKRRRKLGLKAVKHGGRDR